MTVVYSNSSQKYPSKEFLVTKLDNFVFVFFFVKFCSYTNSRVLISIITIIFLNSSSKVPKYGPNIFDFLPNVAIREI